MVHQAHFFASAMIQDLDTAMFRQGRLENDDDEDDDDREEKCANQKEPCRLLIIERGPARPKSPFFCVQISKLLYWIDFID